MTSAGTRRVVERLRATPALHLADQVLSSGTNFLAVAVVARLATPREFGMFSIFLVTFFLTAGFNRAVPHAIAMTMDWEDERARSGYFFLPPLIIGVMATGMLVAAFAFVDPGWMLLPLLLLPMLLQDAVRMHAFAVQRPQLALLSDAVWLAVVAAAAVLVTNAGSGAAVWGLGGLAALLVTRPWQIRLRLQRRPVRAAVMSAALEYAILVGLGYLTPLLAAPIIEVVGVGALQGSNVVRGPVILLVQGLLLHRMAGPPIRPDTCLREAANLSATVLAATLLCAPPLFILRDVYGPQILGATWPSVRPLVPPALLILVLASVGFGPAVVVRKMGHFTLSAKLQGSLAPLFIVLPLAGAAMAGTEGFLYATTAAYGLQALAWWIVLSRRVAGGSLSSFEAPDASLASPDAF